ncbi:MAG: hypothetical protein COB23_03670 [Methylophaga sp.]|nr:MAG: hypothetical protein COB23_03670 [Methylophaga sp.]
MIEIPRVFTYTSTIMNTPSQVVPVKPINEDKPSTEDHAERRRQFDRRKMKPISAALERRLPSDRRKPSFDVNV